MATVTPTNPVAPSSATSSSGSAGSVTPIEASIGSAPEKVQQLTRPIQVSGLLTQPPTADQITLNTALGSLTIVLPQLAQDQMQKIEQQLLALFQSQKPLTVMLQPGNPPSQAFLLMPSSSAGSATASGPLSSTVTSLAPAQAANAPSLVPDAILPAIVLQPVDSSFAVGTLPSFAAAVMANELTARAEAAMSTIGQSPGQGVPMMSAAPALPPTLGQEEAVAPALNPAIAVPQTAAAQGAALPSAGSIAALFQPGTELSLTVNAITPPGLAPPEAILPNQITATVIGAGPGGQLLLRAGDTALYVQQPASVPVGSSLLLTVAPSRASLPTPLPAPDIGNFGALQPALAAIAQTNPALAQQMLANVIPQPNPALAGTLFLLFAAFGQADMRAWFGPSPADILAKMGRAELIARISQGLAEGGQLVNDPVVGAWRAYPLPIFANNQFQLLHFYVHGEQRGRGQGAHDDKNKPGVKSVRFLIDVSMSRLGALQLDGFVRPKQLDLIIRSENELPPGLGRDLRAAYTNVLSAIDYAGTLAFQTGRQNWLFIKNPAIAGSMVT
jgi:hypothetical protein